MRRGLFFLLVTAMSASALGACNSAPPPAESVSPPGGPAAAAPSLKLPEGAGCSASIARYRAIQDNDLSMGHVDKSVYNQIQSEIADAERACAAGADAKAQSLIRASKSRHGYPA